MHSFALERSPYIAKPLFSLKPYTDLRQGKGSRHGYGPRDEVKVLPTAAPSQPANRELT